MSELRKELEESLKEIIVLNDVVQFFNLLINFKKVLEASKTPTAFGYPHTISGNLLDSLKQLFDSSDDFPENVKETNLKLTTIHALDISKDIKERRTLGYLIDPPFRTLSFPANVTEERHLDWLTYSDIYCYKSDTEAKDYIRKRLSFPSYDSKNAFSKRSVHYLKQTSLTTDDCSKYIVEAEKNLDILKWKVWKEELIASDYFSTFTIKKKTSRNPILKERLIYDFSDNPIRRKILQSFKVSEQDAQVFSRTFSELLNLLRVSVSWNLRRDLRRLLNKIINETEAIITVCDKYCKYKSYPPFHKEKESLNVLNIGLCIINQSCDAKADDILNLVLKIGFKQADFTKRDKEILGKLMIGAIEPIELYIKSVFRTYRSRSYTSILRKKFALQIILEKYAKFSLKVPETFVFSKYKKIQNSIEILDKINKKWCSDSDSDDSESNSDSDDSKSDSEINTDKSDA